MPISRMGLAAALLGTVVALQAMLLLVPGLRTASQSSPAAANAHQAAALQAPVPASSQQQTASDSSLFDALSAAAVSPRGVAARDIGALKALENANTLLLSAGPSRDTDEGAFWLKRYVASTLGEERTVRALTQLGSVYAEPNGRAPDYTKARQLWEIASAAGDPVAMCFLGALSEHGLGVALDKKSALQWYERSKIAGGCAGIEESLARVRQ